MSNNVSGPLNSSGQEIVSAPNLELAQGAAIASKTGPLIQALADDTLPTFTDATINPLTQTLKGALRTTQAAPTSTVQNWIQNGSASYTIPAGKWAFVTFSCAGYTGQYAYCDVDTKHILLGTNNTTDSSSTQLIALAGDVIDIVSSGTSAWAAYHIALFDI